MRIFTTLLFIIIANILQHGSIEHVTASNTSSGWRQTLAITPDGTHYIASLDTQVCYDGVFNEQVEFVRITDGQTTQTLPTNPCFAEISISPDGSTLIVAGGDTIETWDIRSSNQVNSVFNAATSAFVWRPDSSDTAYAVGRGLRVRDPRTEQFGDTLDGHSETILAIAWHPSGQLIASGGLDGNIIIWDYNTLSELQRLNDAIQVGVSSLDWNSDGTLLAAGVDDASGTSSILVWDVSQNRIVSTISAHQDGIVSVAWSPDGQYIASSSSDGTVKIWDMAANTLTETLSNNVAFTNVVWTPGGGRVLFQNYDYDSIEDGVQVTAPAASPQRIQTVEANCSVDTLLITDPTTNINGYRAEVEALTSQQIDDACREDLLALVDKIMENDPTCCGQQVNQLPTANAGADQTVNDAADTALVTLDGSASSDPDGTISDYVWMENGAEIATGVTPQVSLPVGVHTITLTVTDDDGATASDEVVVTVMPVGGLMGLKSHLCQIAMAIMRFTS